MGESSRRSVMGVDNVPSVWNKVVLRTLGCSGVECGCDQSGLI